MAKFGPKLEREQILLGNFVDIGVELFAMATTLSYADHLLGLNPSDTTPQDLADLYCREARQRIAASCHAVASNHNRLYRKLGDLFMEGKLAWLADGATQPNSPAVPGLGEERVRSPGGKCRPRQPERAGQGGYAEQGRGRLTTREPALRRRSLRQAIPFAEGLAGGHAARTRKLRLCARRVAPDAGKIGSSRLYQPRSTQVAPRKGLDRSRAVAARIASYCLAL